MTICIDSLSFDAPVENEERGQIASELAPESEANNKRMSRHPRLHELTRIVDLAQTPEQLSTNQLKSKYIEKVFVFFATLFSKPATQLPSNRNTGA